MSQFGTTDNVSGHIDLADINKRQESETNSFSNSKGIVRPTFEWNDRSYQAFKEITATGVPTNGKETFSNGWGFARSVVSNKGMLDRWENPGFMEKCDLRQGKVKHLIYNMKRLRAREYDGNGEPTGKTNKYSNDILVVRIA